MKKTLSIILCTLLAFGAVLTTVSCASDSDSSSNTPKEVSTTGVSITLASTEISAEGEVTLTATVTPADSTDSVNWEIISGTGKAALSATTGKTVKLTGSNTETADASVTVKVTSGTKSDSKTITVKGKVIPPAPQPQTKTVQLVRNPYDGSNETYKGIQALIEIRTTAEPFASVAVGDKYTVVLKGTSTREINPQVLFWDGSTGVDAALSAWGNMQAFASTFNISKELTITKAPSSTDVAAFKLMLDVPAGASATADVEPVTLTLTEFKVTKKTTEGNAPVVSEWTLVNDFTTAALDTTKWQLADWTNGSMFYCGWKPDHVTFNESNNGLMKIKLDDTTFVSGAASIPYTSGELRTTGRYGYGYYEVKMKPCKYSGTNSSFFLYTKDDENNIPWNEVDIEFLGKDTTKVQFNYYVDNAGEGHEYLLQNLGFDASEDFHVYGIEYAATYIKWYVDGQLVYTATGCTENGHSHAKGTLPSQNMQIMTNFWPGTTVDEWLGTFTYSAPLYAEYDYIKFKQAE